MKSKLYKFLFPLITLGLAFGTYWVAYPNDLFLPITPFKNPSKYIIEKQFSSFKILSKDHVNSDLSRLLKNPNMFLEDSGSWIKNNKKRTVAIAEVGTSKFFIKRYNIQNFWDYVSKCPFRSSKAFRSFYYSTQFEAKQISTPQPIALFEKRFGFLWTTTYIIYEWMDGITLHEALKTSLLEEHEKIDIFLQLRCHFKTMYHNKWVHRDLTLQNLFIMEGKLYLLDLDDLHSYAFNNIFFRNKFKKKHLLFLNSNLSHYDMQIEDPFLVTLIN